MSGFVDRMVTRALAPQRVLRPQVHSAFESYATQTFEEPSFSEATGETSSITTSRSAQIEPPTPRRARVTESPDRAPQPRADQIERETDASHEPRITHEEHNSTNAPPHEAETRHPDAATTIVEREVVQPPQVRTIVRTRRGGERIERLHLRERSVERELVEGPVEITIGRIDVRAVVDSPREQPSRTNRPAAPSMSLRDYLGERDARRRR
ncbi:MAG: hypothetical protein M3Q69_00710 [Acidobacteriota bacterium]|nr:hypothetical protein [Acidobacteriota bacterium]